MTDKRKRDRQPWTIGERLVLAAVMVTIVGAAAWALWRRALDTDPVLPRQPAVVLPSPNGYDYFVAASRISTEPPFTSSVILPRPKTPSAKDAAVIATDAAAFALLHKGLLLPVAVRPTGATYPAGTKLRSLSRALGVRARLQFMADQWDGGAQTSVDNLQFGETQSKGGPLIPWLVGEACAAIARRAAWMAVDHVSRSCAAACAGRMASIDSERWSAGDAIAADRYVELGVVATAMSGPDWRSSVADATQNTDAGTSERAGLLNRLEWMSKQDVVNTVDVAIDQSIADTRKPYSQRSHRATNDLLVQATVPESYRIIVRDALDRTGNRLLMLAFALRAYRFDHGAYPATLAELCPRYLPAIPNDPFADDHPFHYRQQGSSFLLYSIGPDGVDDGGKPCPPPSPTATSRFVTEDSKGDIVVGVNTL